MTSAQRLGLGAAGIVVGLLMGGAAARLVPPAPEAVPAPPPAAASSCPQDRELRSEVVGVTRTLTARQEEVRLLRSAGARPMPGVWTDPHIDGGAHSVVRPKLVEAARALEVELLKLDCREYPCSGFLRAPAAGLGPALADALAERGLPHAEVVAVEDRLLAVHLHVDVPSEQLAARQAYRRRALAAVWSSDIASPR